MRKKLLTVTLTIFMALSLAACGSDKKDSDETEVIETTAEETNVEESVGETSVEETEEEHATEEVATEGENTTEYQLTQMNSGFYGGIAWATVADDTGAKKVLINKDLQIVYELPEGMETGDIFDGRAVVIHSDQASNPGFMILGADGTVLYECSDHLTGDARLSGYNVNFTRDGAAIYERKESGLTANTAYACVLNNQFETVAQIDISYWGDYSSEIDSRRVYYYLSDGVYGGGVDDSLGFEGRIMFILNANEHNMVMNEEAYQYGICSYFTDMDRCVGLLSSGVPMVAVNAEDIDYSRITDMEMLKDLIAGSGRAYAYASSYYQIYNSTGEEEKHIAFNHDIIGFTVQETTGIENIEGVVIPDLGARITSFKLSNDGKYVALELRGADENYYYTVISSDGQKLYEPVMVDQLSISDYSWYDAWGVCDGYIMGQSGNGITPDGKVFQLGDGTALSDIGENSLLYYIDTVSTNRKGFFMISDGYIVCKSKLYRSDGTEVTTVTAVN